MKKINLTLALFAFSFPLFSQAKDWPVWGGDGSRNMVTTEKGLVTNFSPGDMSDDEVVEYVHEGWNEIWSNYI